MSASERVLPLVILAVVLGGCGSGDAAPADPIEPSTAVSATTVDPDAPTTVSEAPGPEGEATGEGMATTGGATPSSSTPGSTAPASDPPATQTSPDTPASSGAAVPRAVATYRYASHGESSFGTNPSTTYETTTHLTVDAAQSGEQVATFDGRADDGTGTVTETTLVYREDGVYLSDLVVTSHLGGGFTDIREWHLGTPELVGPTDAAPGDRMTFTMDNGNTTAAVDIEVLRREDIAIGGSTVNAVVARTTTRLSGDLNGEQVSTQWIRPSDFLLLRDESNSDVGNSLGRSKSSSTSLLTSLSPS